MAMDVDNDGSASGSNGARARRAPGGRATHWAVSLQPDTTRPAACKRCGEIFEPDELRVCTWGEREQSRWIHPACLGEGRQVVQQVTPMGRATQQHAATVLAGMAMDTDVLMAEAVESSPDEEAAKAQWAENRLPSAAWWARLGWQSVLRQGLDTFVQIPERLQGAVSNARGKTLEVLEAARVRGDSENEWKAVLSFDLLLLGRGRNTNTCAESLEERLAWWWGGQWEALWASGPQRLQRRRHQRHLQVDLQTVSGPDAFRHSAQQGKKVGRLLLLRYSATSSRPAPRTEETLRKVKQLFPQSTQANNFSANLGAVTGPTDELRQQVEEEVLKLLRRPPKLTAPGLLGTRLEHLAACSEDPDTLRESSPGQRSCSVWRSAHTSYRSTAHCGGGGPTQRRKRRP